MTLPSAAQNDIQGHLSDEALEDYSLDKLGGASLAAVEEHLLVCERCRDRLVRIEPVNFLHYTQDGPVYSRVTRLTTGKAMARHWGPDLHGGRIFGSVRDATGYLSDSFSQMYPEHTCDGSCGSPPQEPVAEFFNCRHRTCP
jgi:hypothetical protein